MKTKTLLKLLFFTLALIISVGTYAQTKGSAKDYEDLEKKAEKINEKGGLAAVGSAEADATRPSKGKDASEAAGLASIARTCSVYVGNTLKDFGDATGLNLKHADVFKRMTELATETIVKGARRTHARYYNISRQQKKDGIATYYILVYITPQNIYDAIEREVKKEDIIYQEWKALEYAKEHEQLLQKNREVEQLMEKE